MAEAKSGGRALLVGVGERGLLEGVGEPGVQPQAPEHRARGLPAVTLLEHREHATGARERFLTLCVMKPR